MVEISNLKVYDLEECIRSGRNAMRLTPSDYSSEDFEKSLERAKKRNQPFLVTLLLPQNKYITMGKSTHFIGQPLYSQVIKLLDKAKIPKISREKCGERYIK